MNILEFAIKSASGSPLNLVFAIGGVIGGYFVVFVARHLINKKWPGGRICAAIAAITGGICTFTYMGLTNSEAYIQKRKAGISAELGDDIVWRNEALARTWEIIAADGGQEGVTPIVEGGTMIKLASLADGQIYAQEAAQVLENKLIEDYASSSNVPYQSKEDIAVTVMAANQNQELRNASESSPYALYQDNSIANQVLELRIDEFFLAESEEIAMRKDGALRNTVWIGAGIIVLMSLCVAWGGWRDLLSTK